MKNKRILFFANDLGTNLINSLLDKTAENNNVQLMRRPQSYLTDLRSCHFHPYYVFRRIVTFYIEKKMTRNMIKQLHGEYDYFIAIGLYQVSNSLINEIKKRNPQCKTIIYFYDTFSKRNFSNDIKLFDYKYTFDRDDAHKYNLHYLPFFIDKHSCEKIRYDLCLVGQWNIGNVSRFYVLDTLRNKYPSLRTFFYLKYSKPQKYTRLWFKSKFNFLSNKDYRMFFNKVTMLSDNEILHKESIDYNEIKKIESQSMVVIDINEQRAGLSPRIINALGSGKKVITNQIKIKEEIFYDPDIIYLIDDKNPIIDTKFVTTSPKAFVNIEDLYIESWLDILCGLKENKYNKKSK